MKELFWVSKDNEFVSCQAVEKETETHVKLWNNQAPIPKACIDNENKTFYGKHYFSTEQAAVDYQDRIFKGKRSKKKIEFIPGYHEWQVIVDGNPIYVFDDFSEDIKEDMTAEQVDDLVDDLIYSWQMSFENDCDSLDEDEECPVTPIWETHGEQLRKVMRIAICKHFGVAV